MRAGRLKIWGLAAAAGLTAVSIFSAEAAPSKKRVFTNSEGREIVARVMSATSSTVTIETGGNEFTLPTTKFSEADQEFIAAWLEKNPPAIKYRFVMTDDRKRMNRSQSKKSHELITEEDWLFNLKLTNTSGADLEDLQVRYRIFTSEPVRGKSRARTTSTTDGALELDMLPNNRDLEFQTKEFKITKNELVDGYSWTDGSKGEMAEKIEGVWVKVFHKGANVFDYKSGNSEVKKAAWADAKALKVKPSKE